MSQAVATIPASDLYRKGGQVLRRVAIDKQDLVVESNGYPLVVVLPYEDYEYVKKLRARGLSGLIEEEVEADILREVMEVRHGKSKLKK